VVYFIALMLSLCLSIIVLVLTTKLKDKDSIILKIFGVMLFCIYCVRLFQRSSIDDIFALKGYMQGGIVVFIDILRWITVTLDLIIPTVCFIKIKTLKNLTAFLGPIICLLNIIFLNTNFNAYIGVNNFVSSDYRCYFFIFENAMIGASGIYFLYNKIKEKDFSNFKIQLKYMLICLPLLMLMVFSQSLLQNCFGKINAKAEDFNRMHRFVIYVSFLVPFFVTFFLHNKDYDIRNATLVLFGIAGFYQFYYTYYFPIGPQGLPFHLCHTAIFLSLIASVTKNKAIFYFTYLVNVVGAFFAILFPNTTPDFATLQAQLFWFNHWYAFITPILGVTLKIFKRPTFKLVRGSVYVFAIYMIITIFLNAWLSNYDPNVDYFFLNRNFLVGKFPFLLPIKNGFVLTFNIFNLTFNIYYLYDLIVFVGYVVMIFLTWLIYAYMYKVVDHYTEVKALRDIDVLEIRKLKMELGGRKMSEPVDLKNSDKIIISHFSKKYNGSDSYSVKDLNLEIKSGEIFGFLGHNGSGKSTTIKSLVGIQSLTQGKMEIFGYDITSQPLQAKKLIGYVSDNHALYEYLTGREYINYIADLYDVKEPERTQRLEKYAKMFNLDYAIDREIKGYSHGMKQKVMMIASLIHNPKVWILDEPLTGLDPTSAYEVKQCMIEHAKNGNIVFFSSHIIEVVEKICDKIGIISHGELKGVYDVKTLKENGVSLEDLYMSFVAEKDNILKDIKENEKLLNKESSNENMPSINVENINNLENINNISSNNKRKKNKKSKKNKSIKYHK
jgi:ABC-2 type transport system ATP-binding protein